MTWDRWRGSKAELAKKVGEYAAGISAPPTEVMLSLLHTAIAEADYLEDENAMLRSLFDDFGGTLEAELARRGMTQSELARLSGVSRPCVSTVVNGSRNPRMDTARKIVAALEGR